MRASLRSMTALLLGVFLLGGVAAVPRAMAQPSTPTAATPCPAPSEAETEAVARRFVLERLVNPAVLPELLAPNVVYHRGYTSAVLTLTQAQQTAEIVHAAFPDVHVTINLLIVKDDLATVVWTAEMTHLGVLQPWGTPPTGRHATMEGTSVVRVACGRIVDVWNQVDYLSLLNQLGIVTEAELASVELGNAATPAPTP
jgi:predicted ester cyclase